MHQLYIDYKQAYDILNRVEIIKYSRIPKELVRLVKVTLETTHNKVKIHGKLPPNSETVVRLRQGDSLSTLLFSLCMEKIIKNVKINPGGTVFIRTRQCLAYADNVMILRLSVMYISETLEDVAVVAT
jgi:hypothetical protein